MEVPTYLKILWQDKWLLLFGMVVAAAVGILAGFTVGPDGLTSKATRTYSARTTLLVTSAQDTLYQAEIPAREIPEGYTAPQSIDLSNTAVIYAYLISGSNLQQDVLDAVGEVEPGVESISAVRRTTQPAGNERFPGNLRLPLIDVVAESNSPERAELLAETTTSVFLKHVRAEQDKRRLKADERVVIEVINVGRAEVASASNPYTPVVFTAGGIFVGFLVLVFAIHGLRTTWAKKEKKQHRRKRKGTQESAPAADAESVDNTEDVAATEVEDESSEASTADLAPDAGEEAGPSPDQPNEPSPDQERPVRRREAPGHRPTAD